MNKTDAIPDLMILQSSGTGAWQTLNNCITYISTSDSKSKKYNRGYQNIKKELTLDQTVREGFSEEVPCQLGPEELNELSWQKIG